MNKLLSIYLCINYLFINLSSYLSFYLSISLFKDIWNIRRSLNLKFPDRRTDSGPTSVEALVRAYDGRGDSPYILYKRQGVTTLDVFPDQAPVDGYEETDFLLGWMDEGQCRMLKEYGGGERSVVCIDSTYGSKAYDFHLTTVMVLDGNRQGFPVAFLYSNRLTEATFCLFFLAMKSRSDVVSSSAFMSDMAPQCYNAWRVVMGECPHRLCCSWHVDKSLKDITRRLVKHDGELASNLYQQLRTLMQEQEVIIFEAALHAFIFELESSSVTIALARHLTQNYVNCSTSWAYCYRAHWGLDVNMDFERTHDALRHIYQQGKRNKRLDSAISSLNNLVYDMQLERVTALCRGKIAELRNRHEASLTLNVTSCEAELGQRWIVMSEANDFEAFTVKRWKSDCSCDIRCDECNACIHAYVCNCPDSATVFNMCKHIHLVCRKWHGDMSQGVDDMQNAEIVQAEPPETFRDPVRDTIRFANAEIARLTESAQSQAELACILEALRAVGPKLEALRELPKMESLRAHTASAAFEPIVSARYEPGRYEPACSTFNSANCNAGRPRVQNSQANCDVSYLLASISSIVDA